MTPGELWRRVWYLLNRSRIERELEDHVTLIELGEAEKDQGVIAEG
jgi:hypothetical protein